MSKLYDIFDKAAFADIIRAGAELKELASGFKFTEGPVWIEPRQGLAFSDIPADEMFFWDGQAARGFRKPSGHANGNTLDRQGRLITCEHGNRRLSRTEHDGSVVTLAERFNGKPLNSPNDAVVKSDGSIWFTDPPYGIKPEQVEQPRNYVFRLEPAGGKLSVVSDDFDRPNGLCFSPDERRLYIADSSSRKHVRVFDVGEDGKLTGGAVLAGIDPGVPDGMRVDIAGRLFTTAGDGVWVINPDGYLLGKILLPQTPANCAFGGPERSTLFITAQHSLYSIQLNTSGPR